VGREESVSKQGSCSVHRVTRSTVSRPAPWQPGSREQTCKQSVELAKNRAGTSQRPVGGGSQRDLVERTRALKTEDPKSGARGLTT
jgi:hypothetical protein